MNAADSARAMLRAATADHHDRVDALFSLADLTDRLGYGRFLMAQAAAHLPVERALTAGGAAQVLPDWPQRERAALILADLDGLGLKAPDTGPDTGSGMTFASPAAVLGGVYVLEGSRLGGTLLRRSVPEQFPAAFLGAADSGAWRRLLALLDVALDTAEKRRAAAAAAGQVFVRFEQAGGLYFEGNPVER